MSLIEERSIESIIGILGKRFDRDGLFRLAVQQLQLHGPELKQLKRVKAPHLVKEVADVYLWAKVLLRLERVPRKAIDERAVHFLNKIKAIYLRSNE